STSNVTYASALNVALDVSPASPLVVRPVASLVSTTSNATPGHRPQLRSAAVLTVVDRPPPEGSFRPPYVAGDKTVRFNRAQLRQDHLRNLAPVGNPPALSVAKNWFARPWIDHVREWPGREIHPSENMPDYGRDMANRVGEAALL